ncbi:MAG: hypothetical protein M3032_03360 [Verrucomicrobiota bacterium]|nr:hypothetical protein [Verrucomicrobiota bacterium]
MVGATCRRFCFSVASIASKRGKIPSAQLGAFAERLEPEVRVGRWFKRFSGMTVCAESELVKIFCAVVSFPPARENASHRRANSQTPQAPQPNL